MEDGENACLAGIPLRPRSISLLPALCSFTPNRRMVMPALNVRPFLSCCGFAKAPQPKAVSDYLCQQGWQGKLLDFTDEVAPMVLLFCCITLTQEHLCALVDWVWQALQRKGSSSTPQCRRLRSSGGLSVSSSAAAGPRDASTSCGRSRSPSDAATSAWSASGVTTREHEEMQRQLTFEQTRAARQELELKLLKQLLLHAQNDSAAKDGQVKQL